MRKLSPCIAVSNMSGSILLEPTNVDVGKSVDESNQTFQACENCSDTAEQALQCPIGGTKFLGLLQQIVDELNHSQNERTKGLKSIRNHVRGSSTKDPNDFVKDQIKVLKAGNEMEPP